MSSVPSGKRSWKCPECGGEVFLSLTQLDPIACDACMAKIKGGNRSAAAQGVAGPLAIWTGLPDMTKLAAVFVALIAGLIIGYVTGKATVLPSQSSARPTSEASHPRSKVHSEESTTHDEPAVAKSEDDRPPAPGPGYKWVQGRKKKDGTRGEGHWAKDPHYKGDDDSSNK